MNHGRIKVPELVRSMMSIFRAYDIRGVVGDQLDEDLAEKIGGAVGTFLGVSEIVVGMDIRSHSPSLRDALVKGIRNTGTGVILVGECTTPQLYFAIQHLRCGGGVMVTASHNPPEYNGFKINRGMLSLAGEEIAHLEQMIEQGKITHAGTEGGLREKDIHEAYEQTIVDRVSMDRDLKVVIDAGNGVGGPVAVSLFEALGCEVVPLFCDPDNTFPNHPPDPTRDAYLVDLIAKVKETGADMGIGIDGDADRMIALDEKGRIMRADRALALMAKDLIAHRGEVEILYDVKCSLAVPEVVEASGGRAVMIRTGHSFVKRELKERGSALAGEMSGHIFYTDRWYSFDDGLFAGARLAEIIASQPEPFSTLADQIPAYPSTPELKVPCAEEKKNETIEAITKTFQEKDLKVNTVDGARVDFGDGWFLARRSNTEPIIVMRFEATSESRLAELQGEVRAAISSLIELNW